MQILQDMCFPASIPGDFPISILPRRFCRVPISPPPRRSGRMAPLADGNHYIAQATWARQIGRGRWFQAIKNILPSRELTYILSHLGKTEIAFWSALGDGICQLPGG